RRSSDLGRQKRRLDAPPMRRLAQPDVLKNAAIAAVITATACCPSFLLWPERSAPVWFLEAAVFLCGLVLWSFVFAWHTHYTGRPVWISKPERKWFAVATVLAIGMDLAYYFFIDPTLRAKAPHEFPSDLPHWFAEVLFALSLNQLFVLFAPFAFFIRLFRRSLAAAILTALFGVFILTNKLSMLPGSLPSSLVALLIIGRFAGAYIAV